LKTEKKKRRRGHTFFSPDKVSTQIASVIGRDLERAALEYSTGSEAFDFYRQAQKDSTLKKYKSSVPDDRLTEVAFKKFLATNVHMSNFNFKGLKLPDLKPDTNLRSQILRSARSICFNILSPLTEDEWFTRTKHSGGTSQGVSFMNTSLEAKFTLPMSCNESLKPLVSRYLSFDYQLKGALNKVVRSQGDEIPEYQDSNESRATTVPKNDTTDRMIAIEPTWNMFFQQGLMKSMYRRMSDFGLDVRSLPEIHKRLAKASSITGLNATIDFSNASDCVSHDLVKWLIPPAWFHRLNLVRSSHMKFPNGNVEELNMFSTMGNAVTFPLETIVFYSLAVAVVFQSSLPAGHKLGVLPTVRSKKLVSVFGDDCILPTSCANTFMEICESVGFLVNKEKSFFTLDGGFRESCGGDYLHGMDVRPLNIKAPTSTRVSGLEPWLYIIGNGLLKKYNLHFGNLSYLYDRHALNYIQELFVRHNLVLKIVPNSFPDDAGLKIGHDLDRFLACYPLFRVSKIGVSEHGRVEFRYCRFIYNNKAQKTNHALRYLTALKAKFIKEANIASDSELVISPVIQEVMKTSFLDLNFTTEQEEEFRRRKNGGYVVAKAMTPFWGVIANRKYKG